MRFQTSCQLVTTGMTVGKKKNMSKKGYFYVMASQRNGTLYAGVTNDLVRRVAEHKDGTIKGFTAKYNVKMLIYYEPYDRIDEAIQREKNVKEWKRTWKLALIEKMNPEWRDLYEDIVK